MAGELTERGLPRPAALVWRSYLDEWDRALRAANRPWSTRSNYQLAVTQLASFLASQPDGLGSDAAEDPTDVRRADVGRFLAWMIETRSASTALNKYKGLQQFFRYLVEDEEMARHPMDRIRQPTQPEKPVPVVADDELSALLATCAGKSFADRWDTAIIRLLLNTGARLSEITLLDLDHVDLRRDGSGVDPVPAGAVAACGRAVAGVVPGGAGAAAVGAERGEADAAASG